MVVNVPGRELVINSLYGCLTTIYVYFLKNSVLAFPQSVQVGQGYIPCEVGRGKDCTGVGLLRVDVTWSWPGEMPAEHP